MAPDLPARDEIIDVLQKIAEHGLAPRGTWLPDVGTGAFLRHLDEEILTGLIANGGATCRFFEGPYGAGKTHILEMIAKRGLERGMAVAKADLSQELKLEQWKQMTAFIIETLEVSTGGHVVRGLPRILRNLGERGMARVNALQQAALPHVGFKNAMVHAVQAGQAGHGMSVPLQSFLLGERVPVADLRASGATGVKNPLSARNAEHVLNTVLGGLFHLGVRGTMLLFDEHERSFQFNSRLVPKRVKVAANLMRRLIDACIASQLPGTIAVFAVLPEFLGQCAIAYPALGQRVEAPVDDGPGLSWRWPVLPVESISCMGDVDRFVDEAITRFVELAQACGARKPDLNEDLRRSADAVLQTNASAGFRRPMFKRLASVVLSAIDDLEGNGAVA